MEPFSQAAKKEEKNTKICEVNKKQLAAVTGDVVIKWNKIHLQTCRKRFSNWATVKISLCGTSVGLGGGGGVGVLKVLVSWIKTSKDSVHENSFKA